MQLRSKVIILSREKLEMLIKSGLQSNTVIISFYDPPSNRNPKEYEPIDFSACRTPVFMVAVHDIDMDSLNEYGVTSESYFPEADRLADFIYRANEKGLTIICQCEYGQSRSPACAAAILEHFEGKGISVFADYRYYPNKLIFNKMLEAFRSMTVKNYEESKIQSLSTNTPHYQAEMLKCPHCLHIGQISSLNRKYSLSQKGNVLQLSCEIIDIKDLSELNWTNDFQMSFSSMSISEELQFDFDTGNVNAFLCDKSNPVFSRTIMNADIFSLRDPASQIFENIRIRRTIRRAYEAIASCKCPFSDDEISLSTLFLMTHFVGYDRSFYHAIPLAYSSTPHIDFIAASFNTISRRMHNNSGIPELYDCLQLPKCKSIKKIIFQKPQLLFYYKELEVLWTVINDPNLFCSLLNCSRIFTIVSFIHKYGKVIEYYSMLKEVKGVVWFCQKLEHDISLCFDSVNESIEYFAMNDYEKQQLKNRYISSQFKSPYISIPMPTIEQIPDCTIYGYHFSWLRSTIECSQVGIALHNCLTGYGPDNNPVIAIKKDGKYVAAIEMENGDIYQAYEKRNKRIDLQSELGKAYSKWCSRFNLTMNQYH